MSEERVSALGERAVAILNSSHNVVFTGDLHIGAETPRDDVIFLARAIDTVRPRCDRRPEPTALRLRRTRT